MKGRRYEKLVREIKAEYPGTRVIVDPHTPRDGGRDIRWIVRILDCPVRRTPHAVDYAYHRALEIWGGPSFPFFIDAYGPRETRRYLAMRAARAQALRARGRRAQVATVRGLRPVRPRRGSSVSA